MYARRKFVRKANRKRRNARKLNRKRVAQRNHIFTETFKASNLIINDDGTTPLPAQFLNADIASMSQVSHYKALYDKYRILKLTWTIIPKFGQSENNQAEANIGSGGPYDSNIRMHYRRSWQGAGTGTPSNELAMLQLNGVKTRMVSGRPFQISMRYPTTQRIYSDGAGNTSYEQKNLWCSFQDTSYPVHGGLTVFTATDSTGLLGQVGTVCATVFCKVTFAVADPK